MAAKQANQPKSIQQAQTSREVIKQCSPAAVLSLVGLLAAFAVISWQVILQPQATREQAEQSQLTGHYAELINGRVEELRAIVDAMATSTAVRDALASYDDTKRQQLSQLLTRQNPHIARVEIIEKDKAQIDLNAAVPISFAALDLVRRAESRAFVGPEVGPNQGSRLYAAQPITSRGGVAGVLLVVFDHSFLIGSLNREGVLRGNLKVLQTVVGTPTTEVLSLNHSSNQTQFQEQQLIVPHWKIAFAAAANSEADHGGISALTGPFILALIFTFGGIFLGTARLLRHLRQDAQMLGEQGCRLIKGQTGEKIPYNLSAFEQADAALMHAYKKTTAPNPDHKTSASKSSPEIPKQGITAATPESQIKTLKRPEPEPPDNLGIEVNEDLGPLHLDIPWDAAIFRAYDIRGIVDTNLTKDIVYWIGRAFAAEALSQEQTRVVVARDGRHSSIGFEESLTAGLNDAGMDVIQIGQVPTPLLYYATHTLNTGTGIMITGSHNPAPYNGLKMIIDGATIAQDNLQQLYQRLVENNLTQGQGGIEQVSINDRYIDQVLEDVAMAQPLKIVVDCGNGVAGTIAPALLEGLGCDVVELYCDVDGDFPNHHPDPAEAKNLEDLRTVVQAEQADLGLAFDGDGDRLGVVTNTGQIIWPDRLLMLFAKDVVSRNPGADVIYDVKCTSHLNHLVSELGGRPIMWKTGHSNMKAKLKTTGALLAGEFSGHICFGERWYGFDDALYAATRLLEIISAESTNADDLFGQFPGAFSTPEIKLETTEAEKFDIIERLEQHANFEGGALTTIDGIRVDYEDGWGLIRASNTGPVLTLRFESNNAAGLERIQDIFQAQLAAVAPSLSFR